MNQDTASNADLAAYRAEVARLQAAGVVGKAGRLAELFDYLAARGPQAPSATQAEIAAAVFGQAETDADDATVRVYVHRLRKKLDDHYRDHPPAPGATVLEIPAGIYALQLVGNEAAAAPSVPAEMPPFSWRRLPRRVAAGAILALLAAFVLGSQMCLGESSLGPHALALQSAQGDAVLARESLGVALVNILLRRVTTTPIGNT